MTLAADNANTDVVAAAAPMPATFVFPTSVAVGDCLILGVQEVTAESTTITASDISGSVNATGWSLLSGPTDSATSTMRTWVFGIISTGSGTETVTVTRTGTPNGSFGGAKITTDGGAITFGSAATVQDRASTTTLDSGTIDSGSNVGGVMGVIFTQSDQSVTATVGTDISDETLRVHFVWLPYASGGTKSVAATCGTNTVSHSHLIELIEGGGTPAPSITNVEVFDIITLEQANVDVNGTDFDLDALEIRQGGFTYTYTEDSANATAIVFDMATIGTTGPVSAPHPGDATLAVVNTDAQEDTIAITIGDRADSDSLLIGTPNADPDLRLTSTADAEAGDYVMWFNVQGGVIGDVTVNDDLTFDVADGVTAFDFQIWDAGDGTWGDASTQLTEDEEEPAPQAAVETAGAGGIWYEFERVQSEIRRRKKDREDREREQNEIADAQAREIASLLAIQEAKDEERAELSRLQAIADHYARQGVDVPRPILASVMKAHEERTRNALEQMKRELNRLMEEEEAAVISLLMLDD